ncbi:unnamed protein product [Brachionus calyciflorus]|uniref:OTU domain-containing protein n=1 Tax=Brachionus calyciflorus TaxID=104777 RepID=A0A814I7A5_9BILA|nr:unnamed protein product [Brachionus calyciflorus]
MENFTLVPTSKGVEIICITEINYISNYIKNNGDFMISMVKYFRSIHGICYFNSNYYDVSHGSVLKKWNCHHGICLQTTGDGNCLYNSLSLALFGNESYSKNIKLCMVFIILEYEEYFRNLVQSFQYAEGYEKTVVACSTLGIFGNEFNMVALSLLFLRPIK